MKKVALKNLVASLSNGTSKVVSFRYESAGTGEVAQYRLDLGITLKTAAQVDLVIMSAYTPINDTEKAALFEMMKSAREIVENGFSSSSTTLDTYESVCQGVKAHKETGDLYLTGHLVEKVSLSPATIEKKAVKSAPKTLAKRHLEKMLGLKLAKFRQFSLKADQIAGITLAK